MYTAAVWLILKYAAAVLDLYAENEVSMIEKVWHRAARLVSTQHHLTSCVILFF